MRRYQRRNRAGLAKERWIMAGTAVFVLSALTLTGIYVRDINKKEDDGYVVDFSAMEGNIADKVEEIQEAQGEDQLGENAIDSTVPSDDLDFDPYFQEANSNQVKNYEPAADLPQSMKEKIGEAEINMEIGTEVAAGEQNQTVVPEVTQDIFKEIASEHLEIGEAVMAAETTVDTNPAKATKAAADTGTGTTEKAAANVNKDAASADVPAISTSTQSTPAFRDGDNLVWPVAGNVLINYSMDKTIYFPTLQQYKYNPAIVIQATEGEIISAGAAGKVARIYKDNQIGNTIILDLGNGYELTYGQLDNILVSEGSYVAAGDVIAEVAAPTKYFCVEGTNIYFKLTKDGKPVNPMSKLQ